jgi:hypothetical protein
MDSSIYGTHPTDGAPVYSPKVRCGSIYIYVDFSAEAP